MFNNKSHLPVHVQKKVYIVNNSLLIEKFLVISILASDKEFVFCKN